MLPTLNLHKSSGLFGSFTVRTIFFNEPDGDGWYRLYKLSYNDEVMKDGFMHGMWTLHAVYHPESNILNSKPISGEAFCRNLTVDEENKMKKIVSKNESPLKTGAN